MEFVPCFAGGCHGLGFSLWVWILFSFCFCVFIVLSFFHSLCPVFVSLHFYQFPPVLVGVNSLPLLLHAVTLQIITPPPPCWTAAMRFLCWYVAFGCKLWPNISSFVSFVQRTLSNISCGLFITKLCYHLPFFRDTKAFSFLNLSKQAALFQSFSNSSNMNFCICWPRSSVRGVALGFFALSHCTVWPRGEFAGKIGKCLECFALVKNVFYWRMMNFKMFENSLITLHELLGCNN